MARTWLSITVELLSGRGQDLWPRPGRIFAVGPSHTFAALADAINTAFARWDRAHLSVFDLADGSMVTDEFTIQEMGGGGLGRITRSYDIEHLKVSRMLRPGDEFRFTFDLGDNWVHACRVEEVKVDPMETLGIRPTAPLPFWGWGAMPDQYGRRTADDDGESRLPRRPAKPHPMQRYVWPRDEELEPIDLAEVRAAVAAGAVEDFLDEITGKAILGVLQQVAQGLPMAVAAGGEEADGAIASVYNSLSRRARPGDAELGEELLALLRRQELPGREILVEPDAFVGAARMIVLGDLYLDGATGRFLFADEESGEGDDQWFPIPGFSPAELRQITTDFIATLTDAKQKGRFEQYISAEEDFIYFLSAIEGEGLDLPWQDFSTERALGRIRTVLAREGMRLRH